MSASDAVATQAENDRSPDAMRTTERPDRRHGFGRSAPELRSCSDKPKNRRPDFDADMTPGMLSELKSRKIASWYNEKVIETLRQEQIPATLFLTGLWIEAYGAATKELSADPLFELGNHSYSHGAFHSPCYRLSPIRESNQAAEVEKTDDRAEGYTFVKISDLLKLPPGEPVKNHASPHQVIAARPAVTPAGFPSPHFFRR
jgi:hypothetical protein